LDVLEPHQQAKALERRKCLVRMKPARVAGTLERAHSARWLRQAERTWPLLLMAVGLRVGRRCWLAE
jgi:hypothetical protein